MYLMYMNICMKLHSFIHRVDKWSYVQLLKVTIVIGSRTISFMLVLSRMLAEQMRYEFRVFVTFDLWVRTYVFSHSVKLDNNRFLFHESKLPCAITIKTLTHTLVETVLFREILPCALE